MERDSDHSDSSDAGEGEYASSSKRRERRGRESTYRIRNALKVPRATTYTAQALYDQIHSSDINLEPEYQRAVVWPEAKQIGIIDSILRNFYIPPLIFCVNAYEDGTETKTCIDGKQRLTSIHRFMSGLIPHRDPLTNEKFWYKDVGTPTGKGQKRNILPEKYRRVFANKQIVCVEYQDITDGDEREIFQRVQLGMALTPAEKIQVISSPRASFIRELQASYLQESSGLVGDTLNWDRSRGGDFRSLAQAVLSIERYPKCTFTLAPLEKWLSQPDAVISEEFHERVHTTFRTLLEIVRDERLSKPLQKPAKVAPIEFVMIVVLVATHMRSMGLTQLSKVIGQMRDDVRRHHVDIRMNDRVARTMMEFVQDVGKKASSEGQDGGASTETKVGRKRKREEDAEGVQGSTGEKEAGEISDCPTRPPSKSSTPPSPSSTPVDSLSIIRQARQSLLPSQRPISSTSTASHKPHSSNITLTTTSIPLHPYGHSVTTQPYDNPPQQGYGSLEELLMANPPAADKGAARDHGLKKVLGGRQGSSGQWRPPDTGFNNGYGHG